MRLKKYTLENLSVYNLLSSENINKWAISTHAVIDDIENVIEQILSEHKTKQFISTTSKIHHTAIIGNYVFIGDNVEIGPYSYVKSYTILMPGVKIGFCVELDRCILFENTKAAHHSCIGRCVIGQNSNLAFGFVIATRNLLGNPIKCYGKNGDEILISKRKHHGAIIGSGLNTGINVNIMPGATIGAGVTLFPNNIVKGFVSKE